MVPFLKGKEQNPTVFPAIQDFRCSQEGPGRWWSERCCWACSRKTTAKPPCHWISSPIAPGNRILHCVQRAVRSRARFAAVAFAPNLTSLVFPEARRSIAFAGRALDLHVCAVFSPPEHLVARAVHRRHVPRLWLRAKSLSDPRFHVPLRRRPKISYSDQKTVVITIGWRPAGPTHDAKTNPWFNWVYLRQIWKGIPFKTPGWRFQPVWKIYVKMGIFPK